MDWHLIIYNKFNPLSDYFVLPFDGKNYIELNSLLDMIIIGGKCLYAGPYVCFLLEDDANNIYQLRGPMCFRGVQYVCIDRVKSVQQLEIDGCKKLREQKTITLNSRRYVFSTNAQRKTS